MKGKALERPEWFTVAKYLEYKAQGMTDKQIRETVLFVGDKVFKRFKRELGVNGVSNRGGHNKKEFVPGIVKEFREKGYTIKKLCEKFNCGRATIYRELGR